MNARIRFLTTAEGGRKTSPRAGTYHPQLKLGDVYSSCFVRTADGQAEELELGKEYDIQLELLFPEHYGDFVQDAVECELYEGNHLVARGRFLRGQ